MMASFREFLCTGRLGNLRCGLSMLEVRDLLGEPEDVSTKRNPQIWKYGSLELTFYTPFKTEEPRLASFTIQFHLPTVKLPESLPLSDRLPTSEMSLEEFRELLLDVPVHVDGGVTSGPIQHLVLGSGVRVSFDDGRLYNLTCTMHREPDSNRSPSRFRVGF